ncbi:DUF4389 domain-containing protein [Spirillospora sp. CA-294931]|uniref:DUF4389 domain-containing protein n=1 Tax=Spirillospora sp. CA-294931 TaxID=3240042 RepID=UPI003D93BEB6
MTTTSAVRPLLQDEPRTLGPYRLLGRLGRGGMGTVYLAADPENRRVALKVVNAELTREPAFLARFRTEVSSARKVNRFCTAPVLDAQVEGEPLYIVTEFIKGPNLEDAVTRNGPLPGSELEGLAVGVATALVSIHGAGIVHRDLKPANVLLSPTGPRVIDFGIARALDAADGPTRTGQMVGTPAYIAPELIRGEPVTAASDVFSWGCVVVFGGTGRPPFLGKNVAETFSLITGGRPVLDGLDPALRDLAAAALANDPRDRPTPQEILDRLVGREHADPERAAHNVSMTWMRPPAAVQQPNVPPPAPAPVFDPVPPSATSTTEAPDPTEAPAPVPVAADGPGTVQVDLPYPERWNGPRRWFTLFKGLLVVPHLMIMLVMTILLVVVMLCSWMVIPFTGRYPRSLFLIAQGFQRWSGRVVAYAFMLTDEKFPPFRTLPRPRRRIGS